MENKSTNEHSAEHVEEGREAGLIDEKHLNSLPEDVNKLRDGIIETPIQEYDEGESRKIMRKIDFRLIPLLVVLYLLAFLDRGNSECGSDFVYEFS